MENNQNNFEKNFKLALAETKKLLKTFSKNELIKVATNMALELHVLKYSINDINFIKQKLDELSNKNEGQVNENNINTTNNTNT